jgi:hypothetical protein
MLMIDCDNARDEAGIDGYERLCADLIREHKLPTVLRLPISGPIEDPATRGVMRLRWWDGRPAELHALDEAGWNALVDRLLGEHFGEAG